MKTINVSAVVFNSVKGIDIGSAIKKAIPGVYSVTTNDLPTYLVTISWPADPDRGSETYGPFDNADQRDRWVEQCIEAGERGWRALAGAEYHLHRINAPFDPIGLADNG